VASSVSRSLEAGEEALMAKTARPSGWRNGPDVDTAPWSILLDNGCRYSPSCLTCPFEVCRYDRTDGIAGLLREKRDAEIRRLREAGQAPEVIAAQMGVSKRSVYRVTRGSA